MEHKAYTLELRDPEEPDEAPLEIEVFLVHKGDNLYEVFDVGVPAFFAPFRQGATISATQQQNGHLAFVEVVSESRNKHLTYRCKVTHFTGDMLEKLLGDYPGSDSHWDPTPRLQALLDRIMKGGEIGRAHV